MEYNDQVKLEVFKWRAEMLKKPGILEKASKGVQNKINGIYPKKYHELMTVAIKEMTKVVLIGAKYTTQVPKVNLTLQERDQMAEKVIDNYKKIAMIEGAGTGSGGILAGLADFPLLLGIKIKMLYEIAAIYGFNTANYKERIYILSIFELAFSSQWHTNEVFKRIESWEVYKKTIPDDIEQFDWRAFQQEYRDYLDIAKLMQMLPIIGAPVGAYVNHKLIKKLGYTAMQAYRMRWVRYM